MMNGPRSSSQAGDGFMQFLQAIVIMMFHVPALTVMAFLRRKIGFRLVKPWMIAVGFAIILVLQLITNAVSAGTEFATSTYEQLSGRRTTSSAGDELTAAQKTAIARASEISANAGQLSTPQTDPEAYREAPRGYRFRRTADGTWARNSRGQWIAEPIPAQPTVIPGPTAEERAAQAQAAQAQAADAPITAALTDRLPAIPPLLAFGLIAAIIAIYQRRQGWQRLIEGDRDSKGLDWHTKHRGVSHLQAFLPTLKLNRFQRFVEPGACVIIGFVIARQLSAPLGYWIMFAGICLAFVEALVFDEVVDEYCNDIDNSVEAVERLAMLERNGGPQDGPQHAAGSGPGGVSPGVSDDLDQLMSARRRRRPTQGPGDASPATT